LRANGCKTVAGSIRVRPTLSMHEINTSHFVVIEF